MTFLCLMKYLRPSCTSCPELESRRTTYFDSMRNNSFSPSPHFRKGPYVEVLVSVCDLGRSVWACTVEKFPFREPARHRYVSYTLQSYAMSEPIFSVRDFSKTVTGSVRNRHRKDKMSNLYFRKGDTRKVLPPQSCIPRGRTSSTVHWSNSIQIGTYLYTISLSTGGPDRFRHGHSLHRFRRVTCLT